jgi:hypothetical protein
VLHDRKRALEAQGDERRLGRSAARVKSPASRYDTVEGRNSTNAGSLCEAGSGEKSAESSGATTSGLANPATQASASAAHLKFLHHKRQILSRNFKWKSGTRIINLLVLTFRSS